MYRNLIFFVYSVLPILDNTQERIYLLDRHILISQNFERPPVFLPAGMWQMAKRVVSNEGVFGLYNGLSASLVRQGTYSMTRFAMYETLKAEIAPGGGHLAFYQKVSRS